MKRFVVLCLLAVAAQFAYADVYVLESQGVAAAQAAAAKKAGAAGAHTAPGNRAASNGHVVKPGDKRHGVPLGSLAPQATGSQALVDLSGLKYFINTNITFSTSSSASGAMSEASYTHAVAATTLNGGTTASTLNDSFDGYNSMCLSLNNTVATTCETGNANFVIYNKNGPATTECTGATSGVNRQIVFPTQTSGSVAMSRKVFVPDNDSFARWLNYFTNTGGTPQTVTMVTSNNLGSDSNTIITNSSTGSTTSPFNDATATWVATFQNFTGTNTTTSDPRQAAVLQGPGAPVPLAGINFVNGNDRPFWGYTFTLQPGQTGIIANFVALAPSKVAAATKAASLVSLPSNSLQCMSAAEQGELLNFVAVPPAPAPGPGHLALGLLIALLIALGLLSLRPRWQ